MRVPRVYLLLCVSFFLFLIQCRSSQPLPEPSVRRQNSGSPEPELVKQEAATPLPEYLGSQFSVLSHDESVKAEDIPSVTALLAPFLTEGSSVKVVSSAESLTERTLFISVHSEDFGKLQKTPSGWLSPILKTQDYTVFSFYPVQDVAFNLFREGLTLFPKVEGELRNLGDSISLGPRTYTLTKKVPGFTLFFVTDDQGQEFVLKSNLMRRGPEALLSRGRLADLKAFLYLGHFYPWVPAVETVFTFSHEGGKVLLL